MKKLGKIYKENGKNRCILITGEGKDMGRAVLYPVFHSVLGADNPSFCCPDEISSVFLDEDCREITETKAREIHPNLFKDYENFTKLSNRGSKNRSRKIA